MPGRILTLQRQARELGRLRSGHTVNGEKGPRPVRSATWIVTSHNEDYVKAAAQLWGGKPEKWEPLGNGAAQWRVITEVDAIDAIMPPGDPLSQTNELWTRGGIGRRCDGITDQITDSPCVCLAQFGEEFYKQPKDKRCSATSRLSLILPAMPDVGVFRVETKSFYAANEIAATVDVIRAATGGNSLVPVQVRIEPRTTVSEGKTKQYPVIVLSLRGMTAGQILSGTSPGITLTGGSNGSTALAIEAKGPTAQMFADTALGAPDADTLREIYKEANAAGLLDEIITVVGKTGPLHEMLAVLAKQYVATGPTPPAPEDAKTKVTLWTQCMAAAPTGWSTDNVLTAWYSEHDGIEPADGSVEQLAGFLDRLKNVGPDPDEAVAGELDNAPF